jgi:hypothetical protein
MKPSRRRGTQVSELSVLGARVLGPYIITGENNAGARASHACAAVGDALVNASEMLRQGLTKTGSLMRRAASTLRPISTSFVPAAKREPKRKATGRQARMKRSALARARRQLLRGDNDVEGETDRESS